MKYLKEIVIIFGITVAGEVLNAVLPLPVPAGVYGLFLLLCLLCSGKLRLSDIESTGNLLLELMPLMFIPAAAGISEQAQALKAVLVPVLCITVFSTFFVMAVTGKTTEWILKRQRRRKK